jgi:hypothetical protein
MSAITLLMTLAWFHARNAGYPMGHKMFQEVLFGKE